MSPTKRKTAKKPRRKSVYRLTKIIVRSVLYLVPILLLLNLGYCLLINPNNYPTSNLQGRIPVRSLENQPPLFSSVKFDETPINTKQEIFVSLNSLVEIDVSYTEEIHLQNQSTGVTISANFLDINDILDLNVLFNGERLNYYVTETQAGNYYKIENYNVTELGKVYKVDYSFIFKPNLKGNQFINIPWLFNQNYATVITLPITDIIVQNNKTSDLCTIDVHLDLPLRKLVTEQSGWIDQFVGPKDEWTGNYFEITFVQNDSGVHPVTRILPAKPFDYAINQTVKNSQNNYQFSTTFSEDNLASKIYLTLIPEWWISLIPIAFFIPCVYNIIYPLRLPRNIKKMNSLEFDKAIKKRGLAFSVAKLVIPYYSFALLTVIGSLIGGAISVFVFLFENMNLFDFSFMLIYPLFLGVDAFFLSRNL